MCGEQRARGHEHNLLAQGCCVSGRRYNEAARQAETRRAAPKLQQRATTCPNVAIEVLSPAGSGRARRGQRAAGRRRFGQRADVAEMASGGADVAPPCRAHLRTHDKAATKPARAVVRTHQLQCSSTFDTIAPCLPN